MVVLLLSVLAAAEEKRQSDKLVNLNTATAEELAQLPGVGKEIAKRIVRHREISGRFRAVDELLVIRGIGRKKMKKLKPLVTVEAEEAAGPKEATEKR